MKLLLTGGCGFLGSNLAAHAISKGIDVCVFDSLYRVGATENLLWLQSQGNFKFVHGDTRNTNDVNRVIQEFKPDSMFHLAGQVAMTTSIDNPRMDFEVNTLGTLNVLEAIRQFSPETKVVYTSTNKVYGDLEQYNYTEDSTRYRCDELPNGFHEDVALEFHSPYGCSKGAADQYMLDYHRIYGLNTMVFRHSSMFGGRQFATFDQGWIGWFCQMALETKLGKRNAPFTISGNGKQVRDVLHAKDMINLYFSALDHFDAAAGEAFNIGGGIDNSLSLLELFSLLESIIGKPMHYEKLAPRESDQRVFVADISKAEKMLHWKPEVSCKEGVGMMMNWVETQENK